MISNFFGNHCSLKLSRGDSKSWILECAIVAETLLPVSEDNYKPQIIKMVVEDTIKMNTMISIMLLFTLMF